MGEKKQKSIGQILIEKGVVTEEQVAQALEMQRANPKIRLGEALVQMQAANWDQVYEALAELLGYRFVDLRATRIPAEAIEAMPRVIARKHNLVPVGEEDGVLIVAITDPFDLYAMDSLRFYLNREVRCVLAAPDAVEEAISKYYGIEESTVDNMLAEFTESDLGIQAAVETNGGGRRGLRHDPPGDAAHQRGGEDARERYPHRADEDQTARAVPRGRQLPGNGFPAEETAGADHLAREDHGGD